MRRYRKRELTPFATGVIALVAIVIVTYLGFTKAIPFRHHYTIRVAFRSASTLNKNAPVRIAGVTVGKVTAIQSVRTPGGQDGALVSMRLDDTALPLHRDALVSIRERIFLEGNEFLDLRPGSPSAPKLHDGDTIPMQQTTYPVQLDQILTSLQAGTRRNLQTLIEEYARGLAGPGARGFNRSIQYWPSAYRDSAIVNDATIGLLPHDLSGYIGDAGITAAGLDAHPQALQSLITDFNTTAHAFAIQQSALEQTIAELPRTLHAAQPALAALNAAFPPLRRLIVDFRPAVRSSGPAIDASLPFIRQLRGLVSRPELRGLVADLRPTVPALAMLNQVSLPFLEQTRLFASCSNSVVLPWSHLKVPDVNFPPPGNVYEESTKPLSGLAGETRSGDANGYWFRVLLNAGNYTYNLGQNRFVQTALPILGSNPPKAQVRPPLRPLVPCETQKVPTLNTVVGPPPPSVKTDQAAGDAAMKAALPGILATLRKQAAAAGVKTPISDQPITAAEIQQLAAQYGHTGPLTQLPLLARSARSAR